MRLSVETFRRAVFAILLCVTFAGHARAATGMFVLSPGIKLAYTFGEGGGITWGFEVSVIRMSDTLGAVLAQGVVLDLTWVRKKAFHMRLGYEAISWGVGVEAGPAIVWDARGTHFGFGVTPWLGALYAFPYYTHTFVAGGPSLKELGAYGKLPMCLVCPGGSSGGSSFDDWD